MERLGQKIRERRKLKGLTLRELSGLLGISPSTLHKIEKGVLSPTVILMLEICHALDTPIYTFVRDKKKVFVHIKKDEQKELTANGLAVKLVADNGLISDDISFNIVGCKKGEGLKKHTFPSYVFSYILRGKIRISFNNDVYEADAGDAVYYDGSFPHKTEALTDADLILLYINKKD
ncbi:MAG TPA: XRE family transcriptional regulator [Thermodesulfobacteriota bacterium]|nr:XRE family transcriptional regulator [Thermodesulfobacteriota bacterium]HNU70283.1 XRE family transcriptional regulator [Thermodesulfobacteriota bacterium]